MEKKAETILQLFAQLQRRNFSPDALQLAHRAYALTVSLCSCQYRSSGRTLIDHAVGMTSIMVAVGADACQVAAGLAHNAYLHGDFGTWRRRITPAKRARVRDAIGGAAEDLVSSYTRFAWDAVAIDALRANAARATADERTLVLMRLADQLDIYGDQDALYCHNAPRRREHARTVGPRIAALAEESRFPDLATALTRAFAHAGESTAAHWHEPPWHDGVVVPLSYRIRPPIALYQQVRGRIYRTLGR